jgi:hypothetical protein
MAPKCRGNDEEKVDSLDNRITVFVHGNVGYNGTITEWMHRNSAIDAGSNGITEERNAFEF